MSLHPASEDDAIFEWLLGSQNRRMEIAESFSRLSDHSLQITSGDPLLTWSCLRLFSSTL